MMMIPLIDLISLDLKQIMNCANTKSLLLHRRQYVGKFVKCH